MSIKISFEFALDNKNDYINENFKRMQDLLKKFCKSYLKFTETSSFSVIDKNVDDKEFKEEEHPRDLKGKFMTKGFTGRSQEEPNQYPLPIGTGKTKCYRIPDFKYTGKVAFEDPDQPLNNNQEFFIYLKNISVVGSHVFAGKGSSCTFRDSKMMEKLHGGKQENWVHAYGLIFLTDKATGKQEAYSVHWFASEDNKNNIYGMKIKNQY